VPAIAGGVVRPLATLYGAISDEARYGDMRIKRVAAIWRSDLVAFGELHLASHNRGRDYGRIRRSASHSL
jgi:hypothetical protein